MAERFYLNLPLTLGPVQLTGPEAHHLSQVRRLRPGDAVCLFNGDGQEYVGVVCATHKRAVDIDITTVQAVSRELPFVLEVAAPLPKGDRAQFLIEKLTELGAAAFIPLECERSVVHPREGKMDKLERYVIEASKQCGRNMLMRIESLTALADVLQRRRPGDLAWLAHPLGADVLASAVPADANTCRVIVGPEGGFTEPEIDLAQKADWRLVALGPRILRIETAALALAACLASR